MQNRPFHKSYSDFDTITADKGVKVAFFVGCLIDKAFPHIAHKVVDVMHHFETGLYIPSSQGCCGIPAIASGDMAAFQTLVEYHAQLFSKHRIDYLVTACATCSSTIIKLWPALIKNRDKILVKQVETLAERTVDISWFIDKRLGLPALKESGVKQNVTYHDPCHLKKTLGVMNEPRNVIKGCGHTLIEMADADKCCGMGGSFNLAHYEMSSKIGEEKARNIVDTGCSTIATSCPACMMQISDMLAKQGRNIAVKHPVELFAERLRGQV